MEPFNYEDLRALGTSLPQDIESRKQYGDFKGALRLIDLWLCRDLCGNLRSRLRLEREILRVLPEDYPYTREEAFRQVQGLLPALTGEDFDSLRDAGRLDWIYVNGQERFISSAAGTVRNDLEKARRKEAAALRGSEFEEGSLLQDSIRRMQEKGEDAFRFRVRFTLRIQDDAFRRGHVKVYLPVVCACDYVSDVELTGVSSPSFYLAPEDAPIRTICYEEELEENHDFCVEFTYTSRSVYHDLWSEGALEANRRASACPAPDAGSESAAAGGKRTAASGAAGTVSAAGERNAAPATGAESSGTVFPAGEVRPEDLAESLPHLVFTPFLKDMAAKITEGLATPLEKALAIYEYITSEVTYSYVRSYFAIGNLSEYALLNRRGDCGLQALSFIVLCRICGIPARWQSGNGCCEGRVSCHDWAMFYLEPWGWLYCDPSYGGSAYRCGAPVRRRHFFGNLDPFRVPSCRAFQVQPDPPMTYFRADPYDNQSGEVEYGDGSLREHEFTIRKELLSMERL